MQSNVLLLRIFNSKVIKKCRQLGGTMFSKYLLLTNVGISISLSGAGDIIEQHYEIVTKQKEQWDRVRTHHMSISGMTVGIVCHTWYKYLDRALPGRTLTIVMKKVIIDQIVCSPICISVFFLTLSYLEHLSWEVTKKEIITKGKRLYIAEWVVWPPAQVVNFYFLPTRFRVLYDNTISLGYDVYTSYVRHDNSEEEKPTNLAVIHEDARDTKENS
uniref:Mpv17-like protein 2 n=1 Tax=Cuerna arida TaxID=1464854 RepID=A0A1B6GB50_9HEMI